MLTFSKYAKRYHDRLIIKVDQRTLDPGVHWIKGQNGSGKSTLFKSIAGIIPFEGDIVFNAIDQKRSPVAYRQLVNFSEAEPLYPAFLTAKDLVRFVGKAKGATHGQQSQVIQHFGVDAFFHFSCGTFSSGMLKKLSLALAFLGSPQLIILDEPFITLDEAARKQLDRIIKEFTARGVMFLISSHQDIAPDLKIDHSYKIENQELLNA